MLIIRKAVHLKELLQIKKFKNVKTGFVPTMGALHKGHLSLIQKSKSDTDLTIASIFVNPTQFNDQKDFDNYPLTLEKDLEKLLYAGCDILFIPTVKEIYPDGIDNLSTYNLGYIETVLEGKFRPGHFQGVCQVVHSLLSIVNPNVLFVGQKDFQQCMVIQKLIELNKINTELIICPTLRENDGLAMSSRNMRLNEWERKNAIAIYETLQYVKKRLKPGSIVELKDQAAQYLLSKGFRVDYVEIANTKTFALINKWNGEDKVVVLIAAYLNNIRLIDNMLIN